MPLSPLKRFMGNMILKDKEIISEAMKSLESNKEKLRSKAFTVLLQISENNPEYLYPEWERITEILRKEEVSNKYVAIHLIANLVQIDNADKFEKMFDDFYNLICHESPVVSPHIAEKSGKIIKAKPHLQRRIIEILLTTDKISQCRHKELLKGYVISAFDECFPFIENKEEVFKYVEKQMNSESPKTKKKAKEFLKKYKKYD